MSQHKDTDLGMALSELPPTSDLVTNELTASNSVEKPSSHDAKKDGPPKQDSSTILTGKKLAFAFTGMLVRIHSSTQLCLTDHMVFDTARNLTRCTRSDHSRIGVAEDIDSVQRT
jgi:hypothetical protein